MKDVTKTSTRALEQRYGEANGRDQEAANELQRRGFTSKQLGEVLWDHGQQKWRQQATQANDIACKKRRSVRNAKNRRHRLRRKERRHQEQIARVAQMRQGIWIVGENFDPSACDGTCPF